MRFAYILCMHILHAYCALMLTIHVYKRVASVAAPETLMASRGTSGGLLRHWAQHFLCDAVPRSLLSLRRGASSAESS